MKLPINKIVQGDCIEVMKTFEDNSIDTIITDPPYGLSFMGKKWDYDVPSVEMWKEMLRVAKPGATLLSFGGSRTYHRIACGIEDAGWILKDCIMWLYSTGFPKATDISKQLDKKAGKHNPKLVPTKKGNKKFDRKTTYATDTHTGFTDVSEPATQEAKLWNGWKSHGLKPAYEPIIVAMKPNDGTYANNALKWGVSGLNIDGGRIEHNEEVKETKRGKRKTETWEEGSGFKNEKSSLASASPKGRFPANIILDEKAAEQLGEPSRFFYVAKASKSERNMGCEGLEEKPAFEYGSIKKSEGRTGINTPRTNNHPTVKPLKLMEYLCLLTKTPTGGMVLDPFAGSGTTCMAAKKVGRPYIGIELDKEYCKIAEARINAIQKPLL